SHDKRLWDQSDPQSKVITDVCRSFRGFFYRHDKPVQPSRHPSYDVLVGRQQDNDLIQRGLLSHKIKKKILQLSKQVISAKLAKTDLPSFCHERGNLRQEEKKSATNFSPAE
ncbi:hypothetical protein CDAR_495671, partial [Caerostris darwini]